MRFRPFVRFFIIALALILPMVALPPLGQAVAQWLEKVPTINTQTLDEELSSKEPPFLLDVREPFEVEKGKIEGSATIPLGSLPFHLEELPKDRPIVVYCRSGHRSARAVTFLKESGFKNVQSLEGGMNSWVATHTCDLTKKVC